MAVVIQFALLSAGCQKRPDLPSLPTGAGWRMGDNGTLRLWTGVPCSSVEELQIMFRTSLLRDANPGGGDTAQYLTLVAPPEGITLEFLDVAAPDPVFSVKRQPADGFDWRETDEIVLSMAAEGPVWGSRVSVAEIVAGSAAHPDDTYLFDDIGWKNPTDVERENGQDFLTICTPDPQG